MRGVRCRAPSSGRAVKQTQKSSKLDLAGWGPNKCVDALNWDGYDTIVKRIQSIVEEIIRASGRGWGGYSPIETRRHFGMRPLVARSGL